MYHFIINPKSSSGKESDRTVKELDSQKMPILLISLKKGHATELTRQVYPV